MGGSAVRRTAGAMRISLRSGSGEFIGDRARRGIAMLTRAREFCRRILPRRRRRAGCAIGDARLGYGHAQWRRLPRPPPSAPDGTGEPRALPQACVPRRHVIAIRPCRHAPVRSIRAGRDNPPRMVDVAVPWHGGCRRQMVIRPRHSTDAQALAHRSTRATPRFASWPWWRGGRSAGVRALPRSCINARQRKPPAARRARRKIDHHHGAPRINLRVIVGALRYAPHNYHRSGSGSSRCKSRPR